MTLAPIETSRLVLRAYTGADIPALIPLIDTQEVADTTLRIPHPYTEQDANDFIAKAGSDDGIWLAVTLRSDGRLCGGIGLRVETTHFHAELGYWLGVPFWGKGYATEGSRAMIRYGFEELKLHRIVASHFAHNTASGNILRKLGMSHEGCMRQHYFKRGAFVDAEYYAILREDWERQGQSS